jgi:phage repressor protein C with HTH and peptisase S24 domain
VEVTEENGGEFYPCLEEHSKIADYVVKVEGDSMWPAIIAGDYIAVKKAQTAQPGDIVVVKIDDSTYVKRLQKLQRGKMILASINPIYPPIETAKGEIVGIIAWLHRTPDALKGL